MSSMILSVVIATKNRQEKLNALLGCLQGQDLDPGSWEIVIADDGSEPEFEVTVSGPVPVKVTPTGGVERCYARNGAAREARGDLLVFLDDDMLVRDNFLREHLKAQAEWPGALVVGDVHFPRETLLRPFGKFRHGIENLARPMKRQLGTETGFATAQNMSLPRERFWELGGFNVGVISGEDQELALTHVDRGGLVGYTPAARAVHVDGALDIRAFCERSYWGSYHHVAWVRRRPHSPDNRERVEILGETRWREEPWRRSVLKELRARMDSPTVLRGLFRLADWLENRAPRSGLLRRVYRLTQGIYLQRGFRAGMRDAEETDTARSEP
jgi:glycosyltransferase involved in cell wall biosynthesis